MFTKENLKKVIVPALFMFFILGFYRSFLRVFEAEIMAFLSCRVVFRDKARESTVCFCYLLWTIVFLIGQ